jgi:FMN-dependent NADH-azoreductase
MKKILSIVSSIKGEQSFSIKLSNAIIDRLGEVYPDSVVNVRDLTQEPLPHLEWAQFSSFHTPKEARTEEQNKAVALSDKAVKELFDNDIIIIGVPMYNFGIPSTLKAWVDHIARAGETFSYSEAGPKGLIVGKKVYLAIASGGIYSDGPMKAYDSTESYMRSVLGFLGMTDVTTFRVEGVMMPDLAKIALPKVVEKIDEFAF